MLYEVLLKAHSLSLGVNVLLVVSIFKNVSDVFIFCVSILLYPCMCV